MVDVDVRDLTVEYASGGYVVRPIDHLDNVQAPLWAAGVPARQARARAEELLDRVGLAERLRHRPGDLSGGQQQRVAIARALAHEPPLVLADEPTAHLDYIQVEGVLQLLRTLAEPGRIVVVATHDERLLPLADQIVRLSPAATAASQPPRRLDCRPGQVVFEQGARSDLVYTVEEGEVEIVCQRTDGGVELLALLGPGWGYHPRDGQGRHLAPKARTARNRGEPAPEGPSWSMPRQ